MSCVCNSLYCVFRLLFFNTDVIQHYRFKKEVAHKKYAQPLLSVLLVFFEELLHEFDVFVGHLGDGVGVGTVEVKEPELWDYSCGLGLDGLEVALAEPAVDGVVCVTCGGDNLRYGECIGDVLKFLFEPRAEV